MSTEYTKEEQQEAFKNIANVSIFSLTKIMKIINTAQTRGAFQASEMTFVGSIYDSISQGVNQAMLKAREDLLSQEQARLDSGEVVPDHVTSRVNDVENDSFSGSNGSVQQQAHSFSGSNGSVQQQNELPVYNPEVPGQPSTPEPPVYNPEIPVFQQKPKKEKKEKKSKKEKKEKKSKTRSEHVEIQPVEVIQPVEPVRTHEPVEEFLEDSSDESESSE